MDNRIKYIDTNTEQDAIDICDNMNDIAGQVLVNPTKRADNQGYFVILTGIEANINSNKLSELNSYLESYNIIDQTYEAMVDNGHMPKTEVW